MGFNRELVQDSISMLLKGVGVDENSEVMLETPQRVARSMEELLTPLEFNYSTYPNTPPYKELIIVRDVSFTSLCEHHLLPFSGRIHIGYLPDETLIGLSKLARAAQYRARRLQMQERLTVEIAEWVDATLRPLGVGVIVEAKHLCMSLRGVKDDDATTTTTSLLGQVSQDARTRAEFLALVRGI